MPTVLSLSTSECAKPSDRLHCHSAALIGSQSNRISHELGLLSMWVYLMHKVTCDKKPPLLASHTIRYVTWACPLLTTSQWACPHHQLFIRTHERDAKETAVMPGKSPRNVSSRENDFSSGSEVELWIQLLFEDNIYEWFIKFNMYCRNMHKHTMYKNVPFYPSYI